MKRHKHTFEYAILITWTVLFALLLFGCKTEVVPEPVTTTTLASGKGWHKQYDEYISAALKKNPELMADKKIESICPTYSSLSESQKEEVYIDLFWAIAYFESTYNPKAMYLEKTFTELDAATKMPVVSEGLLQMSYQDALWYKDCPFKFEPDRESHTKDVNSRNGKQSWDSTAEYKTTTDPEKNLQCGVAVFAKLLTNPKFNGWKSEDVLARYWAVMRKPKLNEVLARFKTRAPFCYLGR